MECEHCQTRLSEEDIVCPNCGEPVVRHFSGFESTNDIKQQLKNIVETYGRDIMNDPAQFIAYLNDCIPDYERERKLFRNALSNGVLTMMLKEDNTRIAITKCKEYMSNEMFLSEPATEFVIVCFAYMLDWDYTPTYASGPAEKAVVPAKAAAKPAVKKKTKLFTTADARMYKFKGNIRIQDDYTGIDSFCFDGFGFMRTMQLPDGMLSIGEYAFSECKRLKSIEIPSSVRVIKQGAFNLCGKLMVVHIPMGVTEIADSTFSFCSSLEVVEIPSSVSSIGTEAFLNCENLKKLFLPDSIKYIDPSAFKSCHQLILRCPEGSYPHRFAKENGLKCEVVNKNGDPLY